MSAPMSEGYLSFSNDQFAWLMKQAGRLSKREMAVLLGIIRFTFGFRRKETRLSGSYLEAATGIRATHIPATLKKLVEKEIISVLPRKEKNTNTIRFDWTAVMMLDTPKSGEVDTPKLGVSILPNREVYPSQNGSKVTPKLGEKTIKKTIKKYNKENTGPEVESISQGTDDALF